MKERKEFARVIVPGAEGTGIGLVREFEAERFVLQKFADGVGEGVGIFHVDGEATALLREFPRRLRDPSR